MSLKEKLKKAVKPAKVSTPSDEKLKYTATQPATKLSDVVTVVKNITSNTLVYGFLPPHGKSLAAGASVTIPGDLFAQLKTGGGRNWQRKVDALSNAVTLKLVQVTVNYRNILYCAVDNTTVIAAGDLLYLDTDDVKPASSFTWTSDLTTTRQNFANQFIGVALSSHANGGGAVTNFPVDISPLSHYTFTADNDAHEVGSLVAPKKASGNALLSTTLDATSTAAEAIGRVRRRDASATTTVVVNFQSAYWGGNAAGQQ